MTHHASTTSAWDGWELWYFGSDYLASSEVPPEQWRVHTRLPVEPHLWVVAREPVDGPAAETGARSDAPPIAPRARAA